MGGEDFIFYYGRENFGKHISEVSDGKLDIVVCSREADLYFIWISAYISSIDIGIWPQKTYPKTLIDKPKVSESQARILRLATLKQKNMGSSNSAPEVLTLNYNDRLNQLNYSVRPQSIYLYKLYKYKIDDFSNDSVTTPISLRNIS